MKDIVTRDLSAEGFQYEVNPYTGQTMSVVPQGRWNRGVLYHGYFVARHVPWTPYSYPSVGREPGLFLPPDVPATPAVQGQGEQHKGHAKSLLGRG